MRFESRKRGILLLLALAGVSLLLILASRKGPRRPDGAATLSDSPSPPCIPAEGGRETRQGQQHRDGSETDERTEVALPRSGVHVVDQESRRPVPLVAFSVWRLEGIARQPHGEAIWESPQARPPDAELTTNEDGWLDT